MSFAVELEQVSKRFGKQLAVDRLDLRVPTGSIYGFIGPNGSGKTTTLRMILRILQADQGVIRVLGRSVGQATDDRVGYLPEERGLYKRMRVIDLLTYFAHLKGLRDCDAAVQFWLNKLYAAEWSKKRVDMLSKGMSQKIQFITAVVANPQLVILDEPFSGLDPVNMNVIRDAIVDLRAQGTTVIFSTHDMGVAERMCDTIFMIFRGKKVLDGTLEAIQQRYPANRIRVAFDQPQDEFPALSAVSDVERVGRFFELAVAPASSPQDVLARLIAERSVTHFEVIRPSLHDIFVHIAQPEGDRAPPDSVPTSSLA